MLKKKKLYEAIVILSSESLNKFIYPGETIELSPEDAKVLIDMGAVKEVPNDPNTELPELGKLQD